MQSKWFYDKTRCSRRRRVANSVISIANSWQQNKRGLVIPDALIIHQTAIQLSIKGAHIAVCWPKIMAEGTTNPQRPTPKEIAMNELSFLLLLFRNVRRKPPLLIPFHSITTSTTRRWRGCGWFSHLRRHSQVRHSAHIKWEAVLEIGFLRVIYKTTAKPFSPPSNSLSWLSSPERTRAAAAGGSRRNRRTQRTHNRMRGWM